MTRSASSRPRARMGVVLAVPLGELRHRFQREVCLMSVRRVALLTAGGFAPCLSSAVGGLIERYTEIAPDIEIIAYEHGCLKQPRPMVRQRICALRGERPVALGVELGAANARFGG